VHRSGDTSHTEVLEASRTANPELELEKLDREWDEEKRCYRSVSRLQTLQLVVWLAMIVGIVLIGYGVTVDMKHLGGPGPGPVPYVCMFLGTFFVLGWIVFFLCTRNHRLKIAEYEWVAGGYEARRQKILQDIEASRRSDEDQLPG
jgi:hypothetical protein